MRRFTQLSLTAFTTLALSASLLHSAALAQGNAPASIGSGPAPAGAPQNLLVKAAAGPPSKFVHVGALKLSYLDYGGKANSKGVAIVMLPGLTDTAHIFDDLAPRFTSEYPVYGLTRRGCGDSDKSASDDYSTSARVADIAGFLSALKIKKAILMGHSLAGDELTAFAGKYPDRVAALVYFDAAYDRGQGMFGVFAHLTPAQAASYAASDPRTLQSLAAYRAFWTQFANGAWNSASEANMQDRIVVQKDGTIVEKTPADIAGRLLIATANAHPDESLVKAPALCLFATFSSPADMAKEGVPAAVSDSMHSWQAESVANAKTQMHAQVISYPVGTSHYLFIQYPDRAEGEIKTFLDSPAVKKAAQ